MKYKRRSTGEEKVQKIAAGEEGNYRMERVPLKQTDRHHKSPGGDLCIRDSRGEGELVISGRPYRLTPVFLLCHMQQQSTAFHAADAASGKHPPRPEEREDVKLLSWSSHIF